MKLCVSNLYRFPLAAVYKFNFSTGNASQSYMPVITSPASGSEVL